MSKSSYNINQDRENTSTSTSTRESISNLFLHVMKYGYIVRKYKLNGKNTWSNLEKEINKCNISLGSWTNVSYKFYDDLLKLGVIESESGIDKEEWLYHHFLLQHGRLARKDCYLNRFLQIAYNAGQLSYCLKKNEGSHIYTRERIEYYVLNSMGVAETYVDLTKIKLDKNPEIVICLDNMLKWVEEEIIKLKN
jgi:hypothetical protein